MNRSTTKVQIPIPLGSSSTTFLPPFPSRRLLIYISGWHSTSPLHCFHRELEIDQWRRWRSSAGPSSLFPGLLHRIRPSRSWRECIRGMRHQGGQEGSARPTPHARAGEGAREGLASQAKGSTDSEYLSLLIFHFCCSSCGTNFEASPNDQRLIAVFFNQTLMH